MSSIQYTTFPSETNLTNNNQIKKSKTSSLYTGNGSIALIGQATGAIIPSSAEGISYIL
ncbi:MAG: hypothetical protein ACK5JH_06580 [Anaerocolumna sp.]